MILETKHITKKYMNTIALDDVSINLESGKIYALLGPNGSGKTTWMKTACGLVRAEGEVVFDGHPLKDEDRASIAYMPTEPYFYNWMSIKEVGSYYQDFFQDFDMNRFHGLLVEMGLDEKMRVKSLSSGMMAKLKIAVTLSRRAKLYMFDEPLNGIDLLARDVIVRTIIESLEDDVTLVISSHLVEELEMFVNEAIFIKNGQLVEQVDVEMLREEQGVSLGQHYRAIMG